MKNLSIIFVVMLIIMSTSCNKDSDEGNIANSAIHTLEIDEIAHVFINDDGNHYIENTLISQQDSLIYKLKMDKDVEYRISTSQPNSFYNQTKLTLINQLGDTLSESLNESISKSFIVLKSPESANYYLIVQLMQRTNPTFDFRLYFEELVDNVLTFANKSWLSNGNWEIDNSNAVKLTNYDSHILRHLKLVDIITGNPNVSYIIQSTSNTDFNFGFIMESTDEFSVNNESAYELTNRGYAFLTHYITEQYSVMDLKPEAISYEWGSLDNFINKDFISGVEIKLIYEENQYVVYMDNTRLTPIKGSLKNFSILIQDCGDGYTKIKDFNIY